MMFLSLWFKTIYTHMRLDKVILENFLTYENLEYDISRKPLLVQGRNLTEEDQESNGSGKSGIFTAIEFCIASSNSRGVSDKELVMFGQKEARVQLYATCDIRKESIHIDWKLKVKGSNQLTLKKLDAGGWIEVSFSNVNDGKKYILDWFALEKEDLFNYYIINKSRFKSFFKASNKEKVDLINRFSDASVIDGLEKFDSAELQMEYDGLKSDLDKIEGKVELTTEQIAQEGVRNFEAEGAQMKIDLNCKIAEIKDNILDIEEEIGEIEEAKAADAKALKQEELRLAAIEQKISTAQLVVDSFKEIQYNTQDKLNEVDLLESKKQKVSKLIKEIDVELSGAIVCPSCEHEFMLDCKHGNIDEAKAKLGKAELISQKIEDQIEELEGSIEEIETLDGNQRIEKQALQNKLNGLFSDSQSNNRQVMRYEKLVAEHDKDLNDCNNDIKEHILDIKDLQTQIKGVGANTSESNIKDLEEGLVVLNKRKLELEQLIAKKGDEIYNRNKWANNFKQFRMHLANQSLEAIEFHMNRYLNEMGSDLKVKMEGFKMLSNGTFKDEITAMVVRNVERTFSSFSGGEQGRLLFAAILANRHMLNSTHPYGGLDFLSVDECLEGIDSLGLKSLVKSAKLLDIAVMIITHVTDDEVGDDTLMIEKTNGMSYIKK